MKKIYINPGHSDRDPGAVGYETERRLNVVVAQYMNEYLLANYRCETLVGSNDNLLVVCQEANNWGANLFVAPHFNAGKGDGYEGYVYNKNRVPLGEIFAKYIAEAGQNLRESDIAPGVKIQPGYIVLKHTNMPAIITESAFVDNLKDIQDWNEDHELALLGIAHAKASAAFLNLEKRDQPVYSVSFRGKVGPFTDKKTAEDLLVALKDAGYDVEIVESVV